MTACNGAHHEFVPLNWWQFMKTTVSFCEPCRPITQTQIAFWSASSTNFRVHVIVSGCLICICFNVSSALKNVKHWSRRMIKLVLIWSSQLRRSKTSSKWGVSDHTLLKRLNVPFLVLVLSWGARKLLVKPIRLLVGTKTDRRTKDLRKTEGAMPDEVLLGGVTFVKDLVVHVIEDLRLVVDVASQCWKPVKV